MKEVYTIAEIAEMTGFSFPTVKLFEREPGTIILSRPTTMNKRRYRSIRIACHVYQRVMNKLTVK